MGRRHVQAVRSLGFEMAGLCDLRREAVESVAAEHGYSADICFTDFQEMLQTARPECLVIATTAPSHCDFTCRAAGAGVRFVLCEKPMAASLEECGRMIDACRTAGTRLGINHQMRFMDQYTAPKSLLDDATFGGMRSMTVVGGNGGIAMIATHFVEAFRFIGGEDPIEVSAWFSEEVVRNPRGAEFEDRAGCLRMLTSGGKRLYVDMSADQGHGIQMLFAARNGTIFVDALAGEMVAVVREPQHRDLPTTRYGMPATTTRSRVGPADLVAVTARALRALIDDSGYVTGEDGRKNISAIVAAYASAEQGGRPIRLDSSLARARRFPWA